MWLFLKRYLGWHIWLGLYATAIGALVGIACFAIFLPPLVLFFFQIFAVGVAFAAPLTLLILPVALHVLRAHPRRAVALRIVGAVGGLVSPTIATLVWFSFDRAGPWRMGLRSEAPERLWDDLTPLLVFSLVGSIAGMVCAGLFAKHGDKAAIFDVNAALDSARGSLPPASDAD
jgi:hypothetical protein